MRDIIILVGEAASGKDTILNELVKQPNFRKVVSHTTRPMRDGEVDGKDYHFISGTEFFKFEEERAFIETTEYKTTTGTWYYGFHKDSIEGEGYKLMIMNPHGIEQLIDNDYSHRMILVRVESPTDTRIKRYMARLGKSPTEHQLSEAFLRLNRDIDDFEKFDAKTVYTFDGGRYGKYKIPIIDVDNSGDYDFNDNINWILSEVSECQGD